MSGCLLVSLWAVVQSIPGAVIVDSSAKEILQREKVYLCHSVKIPITPCVLLRLRGYECEKIAPGTYFISKPLDTEENSEKNIPQILGRR